MGARAKVMVGMVEVTADLTEDLRRWHVTIRVAGRLFYSADTFRDGEIDDAIRATADKLVIAQAW